LRGFRGLQVRLNTFLLALCYTVSEVSVPLRGFRGLQAETFLRDVLHDKVFQSPCGVLGVCRAFANSCLPQSLMRFQSPCGVLGVCRQINGLLAGSNKTELFQSPSGVLGVCRP